MSIPDSLSRFSKFELFSTTPQSVFPKGIRSMAHPSKCFLSPKTWTKDQFKQLCRMRPPDHCAPSTFQISGNGLFWDISCSGAHCGFFWDLICSGALCTLFYNLTCTPELMSTYYSGWGKCNLRAVQGKKGNYLSIFFNYFILMIISILLPPGQLSL